MAELRSRSRKVLIVDQQAPAQLLAKVLKGERYDVLTSEHALPPTEDWRADFAIVGLDASHGTINRLEIAREIAALSPKTNVILASMAEQDRELCKPFSHVWTLGPENYFDAILSKLEELGEGKAQRPCFVIMPFSGTEGVAEKDWDDVFYKVIQPTVEQSGRYTCTRSNPPAGDVLDQLIDNLIDAEIVIADLSFRNPNVFYELGVRHAQGGVTVLLSQQELPFDLRGNACIHYDRTPDGLLELRRRLTLDIANVEKEIVAGRQNNFMSRASVRIESRRKEKQAIMHSG